tara:strand:+ start:837 stop:992 length:156 start_codon:yes stop_codon:yes gene_type:complete
MIELKAVVVFKVAVETEETGSMIGGDICQNLGAGLPVLRVWDDKVNAHTVA